MKYFLFLLLPLSANAQIGVGHSVKLVGEIENITKVYYMNDDFYISLSNTYIVNTTSVNMKPTITVGKKLISLKGVDVFATMSTMPFPVYNSSMYNFLVRIPIITTQTLSLQYLHFSNGFGFFHDVNLGADFFVVSIKLF